MASLLVLLAQPARASGVEQPPADLLEFARHWVEQADFSGSLALQQGNQVLASVVRGTSGRGDASITEDTAFWIGSLSKQFAAVAALRLAEQGRLDLQLPISNHFPELGAEALRKSGVACNVEHVLAHTCGLPREIDFDPLYAAGMLTDPAREQRLLSKLRSTSLAFVPGAAFQYSNAGYALMGLLVQRAAGMPYERFLQQTFWEPLGMAHTGIQPRPGITLARGQLGLGFVWLDAATWMLLDASTPAQMGAAGNIYSTPSDLLRWSYALHHGRLLSSAAYENFIRPRQEDYGLGIAVKDKPFGRTLYHAGTHAPHSNSAFLVYVPERDLAFAAVSNRAVEVSGLMDLAMGLLSDAAHVHSDLVAKRPGGRYLLIAALPFLLLFGLPIALLTGIWSCCRGRAKFDRSGWWLQYHNYGLALVPVLFRWRDREFDPWLLSCCAGLMILAWTQRWWVLPRWTKARGYGSLLFKVVTAGVILWLCPVRLRWTFGVVTVLPGLAIAAWAGRRPAPSAERRAVVRSQAEREAN